MIDPRFCQEQFDVTVIGGGIYGATIAWNAANRGFRVALIEKGDFGGGASANSLKILHGGLRYLQYADILQMLTSIRARRRGIKLLPYLAHPKAYLIPTEGLGLHSRFVMTCALLLNDIIGFNRNSGLPSSSRFPNGYVISRQKLAKILPDLAKRNVTGAAIWHDGFIENTERFTLAFVISAAEAGAVVKNYVQAEKILADDKGGVQGVMARDLETNQTFEINSKCVINATGGWLPELLATFPNAHQEKWRWTRAFNLVVNKRFFGEYGVGLEGITEFRDEQRVLQRGKRNYFFAPWQTGTLIGTIYKPFSESPDKAGLSKQEIQEFIDEINQIYPPARLTIEDVTFAQVGIMPAKLQNRRHPELVAPAKDTEIIESPVIPRLLSVKGVKYTTAIEVADKVVKKVARQLGRRYAPPQNETVYGGERIVTLSDIQSFCRRNTIELTEEVMNHLIQRYGARFDKVLTIALKDSSLFARVGDNTLKAEVIYFIRNELARKLTDVIFRRTDLGAFTYPGLDVLRRTANVMAGELNWDKARIDSEIAEAIAHYHRYSITAPGRSLALR